MRERGRGSATWRRRQDTTDPDLARRSPVTADRQSRSTPERRSTGLPALDRELGGGVPVGSVVALIADPASQSELFVRALVAAHETRYLTTVRPAESVARWLDLPVAENVGQTQILDIATQDDIVAGARRAVQSIPRDGAVVIDSAGPLEAAKRSQYRSLLCSLDTTVSEADGVGLIHALTTGGPRSRCRLLTEQVADVVVRLETTVTDVAVENRLVVPKARGIGALEAPIKLTLTDRIVVDTSRDIA